jgi:peptidoglycan/LPS O-acetylase OafA/YrhL
MRGAARSAAIGIAEPSPPPIPAEKLGGLPALTGLRFFAAFFILVGHGTPILIKLNPSPQLALNVANCFLEIGMQLFFVLSGFVIHYNYADVCQQPRNLAKFYIARFARIYPLYMFFLALQLGLYWNVRDVPAVPFYLEMTQSWVYILIGGVPLLLRLSSAHVTWSISTEWFFYCLFPVVAWLLAASRNRLAAALALTALALLGLCLVVTLYLHDQEVNAFAQATWGPRGIDSFFVWLIAFSPVGRLPPFLIGIATAHIFITRYRLPVTKSEQRSGIALLTFALFGVVAMCGAQSVGSRYFNSMALFIYSLSIAVIIFCCARYRSLLSRALSGPLLIACGEASYSIYLFHLPILGSIEVGESLPWTWSNVPYVIVRLATGAVMTIVFSIALYRLYEAPARAKVRTLFSRFTNPGTSRANYCVPVVTCVGFPAALTIVGWIISLR